MSNPLVSIIIPLFNRASLISETLGSIQAQTYSNWECILVDDGSTDNSVEVVSAFAKADRRIQILMRPKYIAKGANACRNFGFENSEGCFVVFFDSDDIMLYDYLEIQLKTILDLEADLVICKLAFFNERAELFEREKPAFSEQLLRDYLQRKLTILTFSILWKRYFLTENILEYDIQLQAAQEWDFISRALMLEPNAAYSNKILVHVREHTDSISYGNFERAEFYYFLARIKFFKKNSLSFDQDLRNYFDNFFKTQFKRSLRNGWIRLAITINTEYFLKTTHKVGYSILGFLAIASFATTKRGELFFKFLQ